MNQYSVLFFLSQLILAGSSFLPLLPRQFGDFSGEQRLYYRLLAEYFYRELFCIVGVHVITEFPSDGTVYSGRVAVFAWKRIEASLLEGQCVNKAGLVVWAFCLIAWSYLKVCRPIELLLILSFRFPQIFAVGYPSFLYVFWAASFFFCSWFSGLLKPLAEHHLCFRMSVNGVIYYWHMLPDYLEFWCCLPTFLSKQWILGGQRLQDHASCIFCHTT